VAAADPQAGTKAATAVATGAGGAPIRLLAASDIAPYVGRDQPEGGMLTEILSGALQLAVPGRAFEVSYDPDRSAHLTQMLPQDVHDIAYPWSMPDCARPGQLDREQKWQCSDFTFSAALYETEIGFYFRTGDELALASDPGLLFGRRLCRPAGSYAEDLEAEALVEPNVTRVAPPTAADCFAQLVAGQVDAVTMTAETAERAIAAAGLGASVVRSELLGAPLSLHAVALNTDADALAVLKAVDEALARMRQDGAWAEIVARQQKADALATR
jgi:polar amino acid transport system substrate-binding protein